MKEIKVAMIGFGGIARTHYAGYLNFQKEGTPIRLVAVCDIDSAKFDAPLKINIDGGKNTLDESIHRYTDVDSLIENEDFDMADICLPTYLHKEYSVKLLKAGKHVICEKPMALSGEECDEMLAASRESGKRLMIAQCLRFAPEYLYLKDCVTDGRFGKLKNIFMERKSAQPRWGFEHWFEKTDKCGGCILDMHVHDVDMARFLLGEPYAVSVLSYDDVVRWSVENSRLYYKDTMVVIDGSWDESATCRFRVGYRARFENATVSSENGVVKVYPEKGEPFTPETPKLNIYGEEIRYFANTVMNDTENDRNPPESACATVKLIEKMRESADKNGEIIMI